MGSITSSPFGNTANDTSSYSQSDVSIGNIIDDAKWTSIFNLVNTERSRRGRSAITNPGFSGTITATDLNSLISGVETSAATLGTFTDKNGYATRAYYLNTSNSAVYFATAGGYTGGIRPTIAVGTLITASHINQLIDKIQAAGTVCVCNCNYCTCNCNYCTCNCNYSCTCNCNYSDKRLKTNIKFIGFEKGLKLYTWNYIWDLNTVHKGVIAQELVGTKYHSALSFDKDGYYMVDYSKLPIKI